VKSDGGLEVSLQSFLTLEIDRGEREFPHHNPLSSGKGSSVAIEQETGWKAELVWMRSGGRGGLFIPVENPTKIPQIFSPQPT